MELIHCIQPFGTNTFGTSDKPSCQQYTHKLSVSTPYNKNHKNVKLWLLTLPRAVWYKSQRSWQSDIRRQPRDISTGFHSKHNHRATNILDPTFYLSLLPIPSLLICFSQFHPHYPSLSFCLHLFFFLSLPPVL